MSNQNSAANKLNESPAKPQGTKEPPKVVDMTKQITDPRELKIKSIIDIGRQIKRRSQLSEELGVVNNLTFEDGSKEKASIQISDSGSGIFENENPALVADLHEAARQSLMRQIDEINSRIDSFTVAVAA